MTDVTRILSAIERGDPAAVEKLLPLVYDELRQLARQKMAQEKPGQTLQATALVHEMYVRMVDVEKPQHWESRRHFFAAAAEAMRRILVENARHKHRLKRGGEFRREALNDINDIEVNWGFPQADIIALNDALEKLAALDPTKAEIVRLRFFAGLTHEETAGVLGISTVTAKRHWRYARAWLHCELHGDEAPQQVD